MRARAALYPLPIIIGAVKFLTLGIGPAAQALWPYSLVIVAAAMLSVLFLFVFVFVRALRGGLNERLSALGFLAYFAALSGMALAIGFKANAWSAGVAPRYVILPAPFLQPRTWFGLVSREAEAELSFRQPCV